MKKIILFNITICCVIFLVLPSQAQDLDMLIDIALSNNPEIKQFELKYNRISEKQFEAATYPNTEIGFGVFTSTPETRTGAQKFKISVNQKIPFFGTLTARSSYANSLADAQYQEVVIIKRKLIVNVSSAYYNLYGIDAKLKIAAKNKELLRSYEKLALKAVEVGKASAVDVLKLQIRKNEIEQLEEILKQQFQSEQSVINAFLNRPSNQSITISGELVIPHEIDDFQDGMLQLHPELVRYEKLFASVTSSELLNQKERQPLLGFGVDYINVEQRPDMTFEDNGKDILMPKISLSIPVFNKKYKSLSVQNDLRQNEILSEKQHRYNILESQLKSAISKSNTAVISYKTQIKNLSQLSQAHEILLKGYETESNDFIEILDIQELQFKFQMAKISALVAFHREGLIINYLTQ